MNKLRAILLFYSFFTIFGEDLSNLKIAIGEGDVETVENELKKKEVKESLNKPPQGSPPLLNAVISGLGTDTLYNVVDLLLKAGADPTVVVEGNTIFNTGLFVGIPYAVIQALLEHGAKRVINTVSHEHRVTPLIEVITADYFENIEDQLKVLELLIESGADVSKIVKPSGKERAKSPIFEAIEVQRLQIVEALLKAGADPKGDLYFPREEKTKTVLEYAKDFANEEIVTLIEEAQQKDSELVNKLTRLFEKLRKLHKALQ